MREDAFTALLDAADRQPVRVVDLLRAWREAGHGAGALAPLAAEAVAGGPRRRRLGRLPAGPGTGLRTR